MHHSNNGFLNLFDMSTKQSMDQTNNVDLNMMNKLKLCQNSDSQLVWQFLKYY